MFYYVSERKVNIFSGTTEVFHDPDPAGNISIAISTSYCYFCTDYE